VLKPNIDDDLVEPHEAARMLHCSESELFEFVRGGLLKSVAISISGVPESFTRFRYGDVDEFRWANWKDCYLRLKQEQFRDANPDLQEPV
jgi:hypothetical protein